MTKLKISPLFFLMAAAMIFFGCGFECLSYTITVVMHEMAHAEVSRRRGYCLNSITLMPYGASLTGAFEGVKWSDEIIIALAGPVSNICVAVIFIAVWWLAPATYFFTQVFVMSNVFTAVFNLIPIFPLDGGRALLAFLSRKIPRQKAYFVMRWFGFAAALIFIGLFALTLTKQVNVSFALIAIFIFFSTIIPDKNSKYQRLYSMAYRSEKIKQGLTVKEVMVEESMTIFKMLKLLNSNYYYRFSVMNKNFCITKTITETDLEEYSSKFPHDRPIGEILKINGRQ